MGLDDKITEILERVVRVETKIDGYNNLRDKVDRAYGLAKRNEKDIYKMADNAKWLWRTVVGAVIVTVVGVIMNLKGV